QAGRQDVAQAIINLQGQLVEMSTEGQRLIEQNAMQERIVQEVAADIQALGQGAQRSDFLNLAVRYAGDEEKVQALVGLVRPAFDYQFLQEMTEHIAQAEAGERGTLEALRESIVQYTTAIDQQTQMALQQSAQLLQAL